MLRLAAPAVRVAPPPVARSRLRRVRRRVRSVSLRWTSTRFGRRTRVRGASPETVEAETRDRELPRLVPFSEREASDPSGQDGHAFFATPLCGRPQPLGAHYDSTLDAVNFALFSSSAAEVWLVLLTEADLQSGTFQTEIPLDSVHNRTGDVWHIALPKISNPSLLYGYRVAGKHQEEEKTIPEAAGHRHDDTLLLLDPYATTVIGRRRFGELGPDLDYEVALGHSSTWALSASYLPSPEAVFDWEGDQPLNLPLQDLIIYEMHVRGFTQDSTSGVSSPGTYEGMVEKLDYLKALGINCIELMPVHEFNELEYYQLIPGTQDSYRFNFWGYSTVGYFSPMSRYSAAVAQGGSGTALLNEFKSLVRECHVRGMEVMMDVVYNHTAEGNHRGPSLSFRGLDNRVYYMLAPGGEYYNYSGCGNTFNCNHPVVRQFVLDSLRYWVTEMHVDGFRFDLAAIMTRAHSTWHVGEVGSDGRQLGIHGDAILDGRGHMDSGAGDPTGTPLSDPALIAMISDDPVLRKTKLIAEAWDCDGLNQVGAFPHYGGRWGEWNGTFRDVVRNFIKGTDGKWAGDFAAVLCGSPNLYCRDEQDPSNWWRTHGGKRWAGGRGPMHSINFITAHDGFSLADLVSFSEKHNEANGEENRDGETHNASWNSGCEGKTTDPAVQGLRRRQIRNFFCALLLSHGVPMIVMGDEYGHSKGGNNNTYCHDDALNWFNWDRARDRDPDLLRFVRLLNRFRLQRSEFRRKTHISGEDIAWHGDQPDKPDWSEQSRLVAYSVSNPDGSATYIAFNSSHLPRTLELPHLPQKKWQPVVDTGAEAPYDMLAVDAHLNEEAAAGAKSVKGAWTRQGLYPMMPYSCIVLIAVAEDTAPPEAKLF